MEANASASTVLVDDSAPILPTPKSDGAAVQEKADSARNNEAVGGASDSDLDKFSDINS